MARTKGNSELQESFAFVNAPTGASPRPPFEPKELFRLSAQGVYLGTSSWKYRGWEGTIYRGGYASEAQFQRVSLREYTSYFPCVGVEFTYYAWPMPDMMSYLLDSTPENFRLCPKVTKRITMSSFPNLATYGKWAGQKNPDYLHPELFQEQFLEPVERLKGRLGVIWFEFSGPEENELERLDQFFSSIPRNYAYAVEFRNPQLVTPDFYRRLISLGISPVFNAWTHMPNLDRQFQDYLEAGGGEDNTPLVGLGLLQPGMSYEEAVRKFQPYKEAKEVCETGRVELAKLVNYALGHQRKAYILVTNRFEGSAPHTVGGIMDLLARGDRNVR